MKCFKCRDILMQGMELALTAYCNAVNAKLLNPPVC